MSGQSPDGDARFEDATRAGGIDRPLRLHAESEEDIAVVSALVQDAVTEATEAAWLRRRRRFTLLLNRFRWEDAEAARAEGRRFERVRSLLVVNGAMRVRVQGLDPTDRAAVISVLSLAFAPDGEGGGTLHVILAGDGAFAIDVECIDILLQDVSRPYVARAARAPAHELD